LPKLARVAILYDPAIPGTTREVKEDLPVAARALRLTIQPWEVRAADGFEKVFAALNKEPPDGIYVPGGGAVNIAGNKRISALALKSRLPSVEQPTKFEFVINLKTAKQIGVTISPDLLARATKIIR
jgi:hypothetical protein